MSTRRDFVRKAAAAGGLALGQTLLPPWALSAEHGQASLGLTALSGREFDLEVGHASIRIDGRETEAVTVNGHVPAPLLRWKEGDDLTLRVHNRLHGHDTSIHWHGILLPFQMDGVPGVTFPGIKPGETFTYRFPVKQSGTYWYHSHSGLQEQVGHYGPIIIDPKDADPVQADREHVIVLSDWPFADPHRLFGRLKKQSESFNFQKRTVFDFFRDARRDGFGAAFRNRAMWGKMRMGPTDIADVTASAYTYLVNGYSPAENWTALFTPGERVRLRIINASAMTIFDVHIPGLPMTVVQSDGLNLKPVETDEFQIGVAETYDVIVRPEKADAFTLMCETIDRSGYARATLAARAGMQGAIPPRRPRPLLTMKDMAMDHGMDHSGIEHAAPSTAHDPAAHRPQPAAPMEQDPHAAHRQPAAPTQQDPHAHHRQQATPAEHDPHAHHRQPAPQQDPHAGHQGHSMPAAVAQGADHGPQQHHHPNGVGSQALARRPTNRLGEPGLGLEDQPHRTLTYAALSSLDPNPDTRPPGREIEIHLTGNMERFMWSFDGRKYSQIVDPIVLRKDERVRITMVNDSMMTHPIHLHGMFFDVVNGQDAHKPRKHTIIVKPGEKLSVDLTADALGDWAFHCHLLYHMHAGMFQIVSVREQAEGANA